MKKLFIIALVILALGFFVSPALALMSYDLSNGEAGAIEKVEQDLVFEGETADAYETTLDVADPTADRTIILPNASGTISLNPVGANLEYEGATADDYELQLSATDPTADVTVTIPAETSAIMVSSLTTNATDAANAVTGASNALVFEGSSADANEAKIAAANVTADVIYTLPDAAAATYGIMPSTLATNAVDVANSVYGGTAQLIFEGSSADANEAIITATNPTSDTIWTLPVAAAATYSLVSSTLATNAVDVANSVTGGTNQWIFEGATADDYETIITPTDATADRTITLPQLSGTVAVFNGSYAPTAPLRVASGTILNGQTSIAITMTGNAAGNKCLASAQEAPSNACYIKDVVAGTDNVTVTVNTDPGASNLDLAVLCWN